MNVVILYGRLTREPELRYSQSGVANVFFTVAVDRGMSREKRQQAEANNQPTADFIAVKAFGRTAELVGNYFHKGNRIALEGRIQTGSYEKNGERIYTTDIIANRIHFIESAAESRQQSGAFSPPPTNMNYNQDRGGSFDNQSAPSDSFGPKSDDEGYYPIDNEDIPF